MVKKPESIDPHSYIDKHHTLLGQAVQVGHGIISGPVRIPASMQPYHYRQGLADFFSRSHHVKVKAVFAHGWRGKAGHRQLWTYFGEFSALTYFIPRRYRLGRFPSTSAQ